MFFNQIQGSRLSFFEIKFLDDPYLQFTLFCGCEHFAGLETLKSEKNSLT